MVCMQIDLSRAPICLSLYTNLYILNSLFRQALLDSLTSSPLIIFRTSHLRYCPNSPLYICAMTHRNSLTSFGSSGFCVEGLFDSRLKTKQKQTRNLTLYIWSKTRVYFSYSNIPPLALGLHFDFSEFSFELLKKESAASVRVYIHPHFVYEIIEYMYINSAKYLNAKTLSYRIRSGKPRP